MISIKTFRELTLAFDEVMEQPHFDKSSFRVNKKIFATLDVPNKKGVAKLSEIDQSVFCAFDSAIIYPVKGAWGKQGWTTIELNQIKKGMLKDILRSAYLHVAPKRLRP